MKKLLILFLAFGLIVAPQANAYFQPDNIDELDMDGAELILDTDGDTSITADTDDQIDVKIASADDFRFTANTFSVLSGSTLDASSGTTTLSTVTGSINATSATYLRIPVSTVAGLPTAAAGNQGAIAVVTDASAATDCTTGASSTVNICFSNGSAWVDIT